MRNELFRTETPAELIALALCDMAKVKAIDEIPGCLDELHGSPKKVTSKLKDTELLVVRTQDPDTIAENLGAWRARRWLSDVIGDIAAAVRQVVSLGFSRVVIAADHGHMMLPEIPAGDVVQAHSGGWLENKRRVSSVEALIRLLAEGSGRAVSQ